MTRAIFYLTYNGICNNTNGIGTQTKTFLAGMQRHYERLATEFGPFAVHLAGQVCGESWWGYSRDNLAEAQAITRKLGGDVHVCPYQTAANAEFWTPAGWLALSTGAAAIVLNEARRYESTLVIANDIPFLHTPLILERAKADAGVRVQSLVALYGSTYVHLRGSPDPARLQWEREGLAAARCSDVRIGHFSDFMRTHFRERYGVDACAFVPYRSSLLLEHDDFRPLSQVEIAAILARRAIPLDRPLILAFGRADPIKGFDLLLGSLDSLRGRVHLVLNVVPYAADAPILACYRRLIAQHGLSATLLSGYSRELPRALSQWHGTRAVVVPSRGEPLSNIPFEVSLWARRSGPLLVCSNVDGFPEQIDNGVNGLLFDIDAPGDLERVLTEALSLPEERRGAMRAAAAARVLRERDFARNFAQMLAAFWPRTGA